MANHPKPQPALAIDGGPKAFAGMQGTPQPKVGVEEFFAIAERFGFSDAARQRLRQAVSDADLPPRGPHLGRYWGSASPSKGEQFEALARTTFGVKHAVAVCNGTAALHAAMIATGAAAGREVICPATGFLATSMAAALAGATPVFCDVDESLQMDPAKLEALITPRTVAVVPTHHWGFVCDMPRIMEIARRRGLKVIEDCAQSPGASCRGRLVGTWGDVGCFSISSYKIIGGGEGGMAITNDDLLADRMRQVAEGGGLWRPSRFAPERYPGELFVGANYRLSELESAVNVVQLGKLKDVVSRFRTVSRRVRGQLGAYPGIAWQRSNDPDGDIGYLLRFFPATDAQVRRIAAALKAEGLEASGRGADAHPDWHLYRDMFPLYAKFADRCRPELCPVATDLYNRCVSVSLDAWWSPADSDAAAAALNKVLSAYAGAASA